MTASTITAPKSGAGYRYLVVGLLAVVYTFNFMDRQILAKRLELVADVVVVLLSLPPFRKHG